LDQEVNFMNKSICERIMTSVQRALGPESPTNFGCVEQDGVVQISGVAARREDITICGVTARLVPGVTEVRNEVRTKKA